MFCVWLYIVVTISVNNSVSHSLKMYGRASWSWSYGSWIYNHLCNQCLSPLTLWVRIPFRRGVLDTTLCDKVCQWLAAGRWFSLGTLVSSTNKTDCHDITEILWKVALNTINPTPNHKDWHVCRCSSKARHMCIHPSRIRHTSRGLPT